MNVIVARHHRVDAYVELLQDKVYDGNLSSYLITLFGSGRFTEEIFLALDIIGEDAGSWRSKLML